MNKTLLVALVAGAGLLSGCSGQEEATTQQTEAEAPAKVHDKAALTAEAKQAVKGLAGPLKAQLQAAIKANGTAGAVEVCSDIAPKMASAVSAEKGLDLTRVSLKNRNPEMGVPNDWQTKVLQDFEARKLAGEDPMKISYAEVTDGEFRFMKAVPTAKVCLQCHGGDLAPDVTEALAKLYPADRAVGFKEGDIRGAFVVVKALD
jgi:hypothetical protein